MTRAPERALFSCDLASLLFRHRPCVAPQVLLRLVLALALIPTFWGCASKRLLMPKMPGSVGRASPERPALPHLQLDLCDLEVKNRTDRDRWTSDKTIRKTLIAYVKRSARYAAVLDCEGRADPPPEELVRVQLKTTLTPEHSSDRSWVFDIVTAFPAMGFFTPQWGRTKVTALMEFKNTPKPLAPVEVTVSAPYSVILYSWFRTAPTAEAYRRTHQAVFEQLAERLAKQLAQALPPQPLVRTYPAPPQASARTSTQAIVLLRTKPDPKSGSESEPKSKPEEIDPVQLLAGTELYESALAMMNARETRLPERGFRLLAEPVQLPQSEETFFSRYLSSLGGLEASYTGGTASVSSRATTERRGEETVGSGKATSRGYRFSIYRPPDRTGFFFPLRLGFFSQDITISGFREALPDFNLQGPDDISAVVSDPTTGLPVDINEPISYFLRMKSGYIGHGAGFNLVMGTDDVQFFGTVALGLNFFEVRHSDVEINESREKGWSVAFFESGQLYLQAGLQIPAIHMALRTAMEFEWFRGFDYPNPLEFRAGVAFNPEKNIFERERVFVTGASFTTLNWQVSAIYLF